ncbi:Hemolysin-3 [Entamoeba marina]
MCILCDIRNARAHLNPEGERPQTIIEEWFNVLTHLFGIVYAIFQLKMFYNYGKSRKFSTLKYAAIFSFCSCSLVLYLNSACYHLSNIIFSENYCIRYFMQRLDHVSIYIMISGCYTCFIICRTFAKGWNKMGWLAIAIVTGMAFVGFLFTIFSPPSSSTDIYMYLAMGFSCLIYLPAVFYFCPISLIVYLFSGGISYAIGTYFLAWHDLFFSHGIWHLIVWFANFQHALGLFIAVDDEGIKGFKQPVEKNNITQNLVKPKSNPTPKSNDAKYKKLLITFIQALLDASDNPQFDIKLSDELQHKAQEEQAKKLLTDLFSEWEKMKMKNIKSDSNYWVLLKTIGDLDSFQNSRSPSPFL